MFERSRSQSIASRPAAPWIAALLLLTVVVAPTQWQSPVHANGPTVDGAVAEQRRLEAELARQRAQLADLQREQITLAASLRGITSDIDSVGLEIELASRQIEEASRSLEQARGELRKYEIEIGTLSETLTELSVGIEVSTVELIEREALLQDHMRTAYEQSQTSVLEVLLSTDSFTRATSELSYMLTLTDEDRRLAAEIRDRRERLEVRNETLSVGRDALGALRDASAERAAALEEQQELLDQARLALEEKKQQLEELRDAQEVQFASISKTAGEQRDLVAAQEMAVAGQQALVEKLIEAARKLDIAYRGRFVWPERGAFMITQEYTYYHGGLDMAYLNRCGGPIYAAGDGVVFADGRPNSKYGDYAIGVLIGHSQRLATQYWHLSREVVTVGQEVHVGDVIGYEGATGFATGCHLHFGVLFDGVPVNPRRYLP
ncbi:MAG: peptidoglycan DD-metalloendopeptidase family protein [Chloroflexota bacterium]